MALSSLGDERQWISRLEFSLRRGELPVNTNFQFFAGSGGAAPEENLSWFPLSDRLCRASGDVSAVEITAFAGRFARAPGQCTLDPNPNCCHPHSSSLTVCCRATLTWPKKLPEGPRRSQRTYLSHVRCSGRGRISVKLKSSNWHRWLGASLHGPLRSLRMPHPPAPCTAGAG